MAIQTLNIWPKQIASLDADVILPAGNKFRTGFDKYQNLNNLVGVGSVPCTSTATSIAVEKGTITRTAVIVDMKYSINTQYTMIQQMGTASTANVRIYVNDKPWHDNVASTYGINMLVMAELAKISDNYGFIYTEAPRTGRYIAVWRDSSEPFLDICKVIVQGKFCHEDPLIIQDDFVWPNIDLKSIGVDVSFTGPTID